jgi:hypothetical protein
MGSSQDIIEWKYRESEDHFKPIHEQPKGDSGVSGRFAGFRSDSATHTSHQLRLKILKALAIY